MVEGAHGAQKQERGEVMTGVKWTIKADVPAVFRNAIAEGRFINANHAGAYMYMYTDGEGVDQFKHIESRQYLIHRAGTFNRSEGK
jgi:hypothetical protein